MKPCLLHNYVCTVADKMTYLSFRKTQILWYQVCFLTFSHWMEGFGVPATLQLRVKGPSLKLDTVWLFKLLSFVKWTFSSPAKRQKWMSSQLFSQGELYFSPNFMLIKNLKQVEMDSRSIEMIKLLLTCWLLWSSAMQIKRPASIFEAFSTVSVTFNENWDLDSSAVCVCVLLVFEESGKIFNDLLTVIL